MFLEATMIKPLPIALVVATLVSKSTDAVLRELSVYWRIDTDGCASIK
jgi:hypothetical protein